MVVHLRKAASHEIHIVLGLIYSDHILIGWFTSGKQPLTKLK